MKWVNIRETRLLEQAISKNSFRYLTLDEHAIVDKAYNALKESELYKTVWKDIEDKANELVETKCRPEWNRISEEMKPLGDERNALDKEKAADKENFSEEKEARLEELNKKLSELTDEYNSVTNKANAELNEYKEERITKEEWACFFLEDNEYKLVGELVWWALEE